EASGPERRTGDLAAQPHGRGATAGAPPPPRQRGAARPPLPEKRFPELTPALTRIRVGLKRPSAEPTEHFDRDERHLAAALDALHPGGPLTGAARGSRPTAPCGQRPGEAEQRGAGARVQRAPEPAPGHPRPGAVQEQYDRGEPEQAQRGV